MISRIRLFLTALLTLLIAALLALAPVAAKPASGEYQLFDEVAAGHQAFISLAALENFDYHAKIASECCDAGHVAGVGLAEADKTFDGYETLTTGKPSDGLWRPVLRSQTNLSDETIEKIVFGLEATGAVLELGAGGVATIRHAGKVTKVDDLRKLDDAVEEIAETRGVLVGGSYVPRGSAIVRNSTVQLNSNIVTKTGETIPAGSVITENGGAIKIVTPDGVAITGKTDNLLRSQQLALPSPATKGGVPPGYRVLDDSIGAARVDPPAGYRWVADADGDAHLQSTTSGQIYRSVDDLPTPTGRFSGTYEPNPKHDNPGGSVSPQPTNGASALENSVPIGAYRWQ